MERMRTLAFQVPDSLFQRVKAYLEQNHMTQKQFVIGLIETELEQDEAQYQASRPEEQEDEEESDDQDKDEEMEEQIQDEFAPQEAQESPEFQLEEQPAAQEEVAPVDDFEAGSGEIFQNAATYRANCRSLLPPTLSRNGGKHRNGFLRIQFLAIPSEGKRH